MKRIIFTAMLAAALLAGCKDDDGVQPVPDSYSYTADDQAEAAIFALWLDGSLTASGETTRYLMYNLKYLRHAFAERTDLSRGLSVRFIAPWMPGQLNVKFDSVTAIAVRNRTYTGWLQLDPSLRPDTSSRLPDNFGWMFINLNRPLNPQKLAEYYRKLPGVVIAEPDGIAFIGGTFPVFPGIREGELSYLFVENAVMLPTAYHYFRFIGGRPTYIGSWIPSAGPRPSWWPEAQEIINNFSSHAGL